MSIYDTGPTPALGTVAVTQNVMVPMRDGVRLATDIYRPADQNEPLPVILYRTPYSKIGREKEYGWASWFAARGYAVVAQDCRGCYDSEGEVAFLIPEAEDGYDTLAWIAEQPWAGDKVGSYGTSWSGWTQTAMAALGPTNLAAMVPNVSGADAYTSSVRHNGALEMRFMAWAFWHPVQNTQAQLKADPSVDRGLRTNPVHFRDLLARWPIRRGQTRLTLVPDYEHWAFRLLTTADRDEWWDHPSMRPSKHWPQFPDAATLYVGGWYDSYTRATFESFIGHGAVKPGRVKVLVGPWTHGQITMERSFAGDVEFGAAAALPSFREVHLAWYERHLKGQTDADEETPVRIFVMGGGSGERTAEGRILHGGQWRDESEWPLARAKPTPYYLAGDGTLSVQPPADDDSATTYPFDPNDPVPSIGGNVSSLADFHGLDEALEAGEAVTHRNIMEAGGFDQVEAERFFGCSTPYLPLNSRADVLTFETQPLDAAIEVTGPVTMKLWVSTSALDTDFTAKLIDVYPPSPDWPQGFALNLTDSIQRLRYRADNGKAALAEPGEVYELTFSLYPTSNVFAAGHRIRLDISSSNFPRFDVNPNSGEALGLDRRKVVADNTVFHDAVRPSHVVLPVISG